MREKIEERVSKWMESRTDYVSGTSVDFYEDRMFVKVYYKDPNIDHIRIYYIFETLQEALDDLPYVYMGVNLYRDNNEVCLTFKEKK